MPDPINGTPDSNKDSTKRAPTQTERERLEEEKLRREVRELSTPWWQRSSNMASLASITAVIVGLIWAIVNGYFDVSRRELGIMRERILREEANLQTKKRDQEASPPNGSSIATQTPAVPKPLDPPTIIRGEILEAPWLSATQSVEKIEFRLSMANAGASIGKAKITAQVTCGNAEFASPLAFAGQIITWRPFSEGDFNIRLSLNNNETELIRRQVKAIAARERTGFWKMTEEYCIQHNKKWSVDLYLDIYRVDGESAGLHLYSNEAYTWATTSGQ